MGNQIYSYALIKSFYDKGEDYVDCFWPFAIKIFPTENSILTLNYIQTKVAEEFALEIPLHTLRTILHRASKQNYLHETKKKDFRLTEKGLEYSETFETEREVDRRLNSLFGDIEDFLRQRGAHITIQQINEELLHFLRKNLNQFIECFCIGPYDTAAQPDIGHLKTLENHLLEYIEIADQQKPEHYRTLQDIVLGSIISTILSSKQPSEMTAIRQRKFKHCQAFLDTNFIVSLLGLHPQEFVEPAKELCDLLKIHGFRIKVFSFTVDELCRLINGYLAMEYCYPKTIRVDSTLSSHLKSIGWGKTQAKEFIMNIENTLSNEGIEIKWVKGVDLSNYTPKNDKLKSLIGNYKPYQAEFNQNHDLAALEQIKTLRGRSMRKIEKSKAIFLSSDKRLNRFNFLEMGHKENGTICECILDVMLTNVLWLKDPNANVSLKSLIGIYSQDLFVRRRIWKKFYEILQELSREQKLKDRPVSMLFYNRYIEDVLRELDESQLDKITPDFVLEEIENAAKVSEQYAENRLREKEEELLQHLDEEISKKEKEKDEELLERFQLLRKKARQRAERSADIMSAIYASLLTMLLISVMLMIYIFLMKLGSPEILSWIIPLVFGGGGIIGMWAKLKTKFRDKLAEKIYKKRYDRIGLGIGEGKASF